MKKEYHIGNISLTRRRMLALGIAAGLAVTTGAVVYRHVDEKPTVGQEAQVIDKEGDILNGQWKYMPGLTKRDDGIVVHPLDLSIVEQDGSLAAENPPVNLAGTHLDKLRGDFAVTTTFKPLQSKAASIQLYGRVPIIADEFRVERESVRMTVEDSTLKVSIWDGSGQEPVEEKAFRFAPKETDTITMQRQGETLHFSVNDTKLGSASEAGVFDSEQMWFGLDAHGGDWLLSDLQVKKLGGGEFEKADASTIEVRPKEQGLQAYASNKRPHFTVGAAMALGPMTADPEYANVALDKHMFGGMTPENQMKMINIQPQRGVYTFEQADAMVAIAKQNGLTIHGHTLVFAEANPRWFAAMPARTPSDKQQIEGVMQDHITTVVKHFGRDVASWDVINEPLADYDDFEETGQVLRNHKWYQAMGESYIVKALDAAHKANPEAKLFINEYGLEEDGERWDTFVALLRRLKPQLQSLGIPLENVGVGFQAHVYEAADKINPMTLSRHIRQVGQLGYAAQISEMDVYTGDGAEVQAEQYASILQTCLAEPNCKAWRGWILSDRYNFWKDDVGQIQQGEDGLFDTGMKPQLAVTRMQSR